jgi:uncharacterized membrane protein YdjX (TVP38/TMEM64 family)
VSGPLRIAAVTLWALLLAGYLLVVGRSGATPLEAVATLLAFLRDHPLGALAFTLAYALRPLLLLSAAALTVGAGILYGPLLGALVVVVGANAGALLAYALGSLLAADLTERALRHERLRRAVGALRTRTFETTLTLRLAFAPYDAVSYLAGALRLPAAAFLVATALGSLPGSLVFLLVGAGLGDLDALAAGGLPRLEAPLLLASAAFLVLSLALARIWRRREARQAASRHAEERSAEERNAEERNAEVRP